ncbi:MAG: hypothetical protein M5U26_03090 [Planctomycetota bacterium]|nr:hypothetical protein [Planctomycetota bacterium]
MPAATTLAQRLERFLERWGGVIARHRARVLWGAALLGLLSLPGAYHTLRHLDANVLDQVSQKLPRFKDLREVGEDFGGDMLVCVAALADERAGDPAARAELKRLGGLLARELAQVGAHPEDRGAWPEADVLEGEPWLRYVECRAGESMRKALEQLARERLQALLTLEDVKELAAKFEPEALAARMQALRAELAGLDPALDLERRRLMADPLKLAGLAREALDKRLLGRQSGVDPEGYYLSGGRRDAAGPGAAGARRQRP